MFRTTIRELQQRFRATWVVVYGIVEILHSAGLATCTGFHKAPGAAGRPHKLWKLPKTVTINLETGEVTTNCDVTEEPAA